MRVTNLFKQSKKKFLLFLSKIKFLMIFETWKIFTNFSELSKIRDICRYKRDKLIFKKKSAVNINK